MTAARPVVGPFNRVEGDVERPLFGGSPKGFAALSSPEAMVRMPGGEGALFLQIAADPGLEDLGRGEGCTPRCVTLGGDGPALARGVRTGAALPPESGALARQVPGGLPARVAGRQITGSRDPGMIGRVHR